MRIYKGDEKVEAGIYFNLREVAFKSLIDDGRLPGGEDQEWRRVPAVLMLVVAPLVGVTYVMFLPLIGFLMLGGMLARKAYGVLGEHMRAVLDAAVRVLAPVWQPAMAFLGRGRKAQGPPPAGPRDEWAEGVREELGVEPEEEEEK